MGSDLTSNTLKLPPLAARHEAMGAHTADHFGWRATAHFTSAEEEARRTSESVGLADWSWMAKFDLKGFGLSSAPSAGPQAQLWPLGRYHYLAMCKPAERDSVLRQLDSLCLAPEVSSLPPPVYVTDVTSVYAALLLVGPRSRQVLCKLSAPDFSESAFANRSCRQTGLAEVPAIVLREDFGSVPAYRLLAGREYAEWLWDALMHAGKEFEMTPFGLQAGAMLGES